MPLEMQTPKEVAEGLAARVRALREAEGLTQAELAERAGLAFPTYRHFEQTGQISLERLLQVASALGCLDAFGKLFTLPEFRSLDEVEAADQARRRRSR